MRLALVQMTYYSNMKLNLTKSLEVIEIAAMYEAEGENYEYNCISWCI